MDERHYRNKLGWEAASHLSLGVIIASIVGWLLNNDTNAILGVIGTLMGGLILLLSVRIRARLLVKEVHRE